MFPDFLNAYDVLDRPKIDAYMSERGFTFLGEGRSRRTYLSKNKRYVLKFHLDKYTSANQNEAKTWRQFFGKTNPTYGDCLYAPCRLLDGKVLMMKAMVEVYGGTNGCVTARENGLGGADAFKSSEERSKLPEYISKWSVDSQQIGKMANGKYVIYDYG